MKSNRQIAPYVLLTLLAVISMGYYIAGTVALRGEFFHSSRYAREPFALRNDGRTITGLRNEAKTAGLRDGDVLISENRLPFTGEAQTLDFLRRNKPGTTLNVTIRSQRGQNRSVQIRLAAREGPDFTLGGYIAFLTPVLGVPLLALIVGYWVVAARPHDLNAWLVLILLSFPEVAFGNLDWSFWPAPWYLLFGFWNVSVQIYVFAALLWFGFLFPERWRFDRRWPWVKWMVLALTSGIAVIELWAYGARMFDVGSAPEKILWERWADRVDATLSVCCIVLFLLAVVDKLRSASTQDARRRLRVLAIGSGFSLGPLLILFGLLPQFGIDTHHGNWFIGIVPLIALFPLTLAYVLIVQRAMDVRILLRMGTKYLLARATLVILRIGLGVFVIVRFLVPLIQRKQHQALNWLLVAAIAFVLIRIFFRRDSLGSGLQRWLDRKFFREAYNSEIVLSELSEEARRLTDKRTIIETVSRRISEILHVSQIAVWLRGNNVFQLQQAVGFGLTGPVALTDDSAAVQNLVRTNRPATMYRDRPEEWFALAGAEERSVLREVNAELLLPLPGRAGLMGLMTLGPKRSEEPYTPTDLRMLQSVAAQTGLSLEVAELVQSLANETAQRERVNREIEIAREVQQRLFPQRIPELAGLSLAGMCRPALQVGGDYYDFIELEDGRLGLAIGDVSGKGISAALIMASLRASLRGLTLDGPGDLARMMVKVNRLVYESSSASRYATFFFATYDHANHELRYVNAGHNAPMLIKGDSQELMRLETGGLVVGLLPSATYEANSVIMEPGDLLVAYTDGVSEAMTHDDEEWGEERMLAAIPKCACATAPGVVDAVFRAADAFTAGAEQHDDMTLLVMKLIRA